MLRAVMGTGSGLVDCDPTVATHGPTHTRTDAVGPMSLSVSIVTWCAASLNV